MKSRDSSKQGGIMHYKDLVFDKGSLFLVTGGAGFIGSNLCEAILAMGYKVRCLDNLSTGKKENVDLFLGDKNYEFVKGDITDFDTCLAVCEGVDYVLHQAAWGSVPRSIEMPIYYEKVNIQGTLHMMEAARQRKVKKFVYASSSSVYGDHPVLPKKEGMEGNLLSPYALTKRVDEEYGKLYYKLYGLDTYGMRYFNVFGKRQNPDGAYAAVIPKFIKQLLNGEQPTINGDGRQSRDFTYIENVVEANLKACKAGHEVAGQVFNIAFGGREYLIDVYYCLVEALGLRKNNGSVPEPNFGSERAGDIRDSNADIGKAREMLGYEPQYNFKDGIKLAIAWYREKLSMEGIGKE